MSKRKQFTNPDGQEIINPAIPTLAFPVLNEMIPENKVVAFAVNATCLRNYDFSKHYDKGFDAIIIAYQQAIEIMLQGGNVEVSTVTNYCRSGLQHFADYLVIYHSGVKRELRLCDITIDLIENYIRHLKIHYSNGSTAKNHYTHTKSVLIKMQQMQWLEQFEFPRNPFPNSTRKQKGQRAFSKAARRRIAQALKNDTRDILKKSEALTSYELTICLLAIALRSGMNTTPLLEMTSNSIQDNPLHTNRKTLVLYKRRGNNTQIQSLRGARPVENVQTVLPDVVAIVEHILCYNVQLRESIKTNLVFTYRSSGGSNSGEIVPLSQAQLISNTKSWVEKKQLKNDNGDPLVVNVSRLRKTFENRIYELSGGDPFITARLANHSVKVSQEHYLEAPIESVKKFRYLGQIRQQQLLEKNEEFNTPISMCSKKPKHAYKTGKLTYCTSFLSCVRCKYMVVTKDDLYRLLSFYWLIVYQRKNMGAKRWKTYFAHIIRIIDNEILPKFDKEYTIQAKEKAKNNPHPMWKHRQQLEEIA
jgi:hypothetical protein